MTDGLDTSRCTTYINRNPSGTYSPPAGRDGDCDDIYCFSMTPLTASFTSISYLRFYYRAWWDGDPTPAFPGGAYPAPYCFIWPAADADVDSGQGWDQIRSWGVIDHFLVDPYFFPNIFSDLLTISSLTTSPEWYYIDVPYDISTGDTPHAPGGLPWTLSNINGRKFGFHLGPTLVGKTTPVGCYCSAFYLEVWGT